VTFIGSLIIPVYFLLLMADGRKLRAKLQARALDVGIDVPGDEALLIERGKAAWSSPPYYPETQASSGDQHQAF